MRRLAGAAGCRGVFCWLALIVRVVLLLAHARRRAIGLFQAALRGFLGIALAVTIDKRLLILRDGVITAVLQVVHAAEIDMRPSEEPRILADPDGLFEVVAGLVDIALHDSAAGQQEVSACGVAGVAIELLMR